MDDFKVSCFETGDLLYFLINLQSNYYFGILTFG